MQCKHRQLPRAETATNQTIPFFLFFYLILESIKEQTIKEQTKTAFKITQLRESDMYGLDWTPVLLSPAAIYIYIHSI